jgi:hypothetical protein
VGFKHLRFSLHQTDADGGGRDHGPLGAGWSPGPRSLPLIIPAVITDQGEGRAVWGAG